MNVLKIVHVSRHIHICGGIGARSSQGSRGLSDGTMGAR